MFVQELADNVSMRQSIFDACSADMPVYAACGGFMYLTKKITDFDHKDYEMVGVIPASCSMQSKLQTVGYVEVTALTDNVLCTAGDHLRGHEFHFSLMNNEENETPFPWAFTCKKMRTGVIYPSGYAHGNVLASYLHMHFAGHEEAASRFINKCNEFKLAKNI